MPDASSTAAAAPDERSKTINDFCAAEQMSRPFYFKLRRSGKGPRELREGRFVETPRRSACRMADSSASYHSTPWTTRARKGPCLPPGPSRIPFHRWQAMELASVT